MTGHDQEEMTDQRLLGRLEAESFDAALRERERCEREERLTRLAAGDAAAFLPAHELFPEPGRVAFPGRLQHDVERLSGFYHAVVHSRAWRLIQAARRLVGREW